jgi:hypothetical protein
MTDVLDFSIGIGTRDRAGYIIGSDCEGEMTGSRHAPRQIQSTRILRRCNPAGFYEGKPLKSLETLINSTLTAGKLYPSVKH